MMVGHALAYTPSVILWGPSYLSEKWLAHYRKTLLYAKQMHWYMGIATITLMAADLIYTTEPDEGDRASNVAVTALIYCEM